jgi:hypothetical protein
MLLALSLLCCDWAIGQSQTNVLKAKTGFYPSGISLTRTLENNLHTSMVNIGETVDMNVVTTTLTKQKTLKVTKDSQTLLVYPESVDGYMEVNGAKQDLSQKELNVELHYVIAENGYLQRVYGNEDYIKAMKNSGLNNAQVGLNLMVYFRHEKDLNIGDSFTMFHEGNPYTFQKTFYLDSIDDKQAYLHSKQYIVLNQNYDLNGYDMQQKAEGTSDGKHIVRLSDYLITYNEENLFLAGNMEMVAVNIPMTIKGTLKEFINETL